MLELRAHDERELVRLHRFLTRPGLEFALSLVVYADPRVARRLRERAIERAAADGVRVATLELAREDFDVDLVERLERRGAEADVLFVVGIDELLSDELGRPRRAPSLVNLNLHRDALPGRIRARVVIWVSKPGYALLAKLVWDLLEVTLTRFELLAVEPLAVSFDAHEFLRPLTIEEDHEPSARGRAMAWLARSRSAADQRSRADAAAAAASLFVRSGDLGHARACLDRAARGYKRVLDLRAAARQYLGLARLLHRLGQYRGAKHEARRARIFAEASGDADAEFTAQFILVAAAIELGDDELRSVLEEVITRSESRNMLNTLAWALILLGAAPRLEPLTLRELHLQRAAGLYSKLGDRAGLALARMAIGDRRADKGRIEEARRIYLEDVLPTVEQIGDEWLQAQLRSRMARIRAQTG